MHKLTPVSYTHLDVYKRQAPGFVEIPSCPSSDCDVVRPIRLSCLQHAETQMHKLTPVSYTHLDVYKRQA
ncbi:hypothetical protein [Burkholderia plantarii]|uniref:hypothetical protein n=1 Tax=Burkholderia plantarii TaxID=41899 RepID=UPI001495FAFC|nr:hypothetical protein [Burkholderia plantarii]